MKSVLACIIIRLCAVFFSSKCLSSERFKQFFPLNFFYFFFFQFNSNETFYLRQEHPMKDIRTNCQSHNGFRIRYRLLCKSMMIWHCIYCELSKRYWWICSSSMGPIDLMNQYRKPLWTFVVVFRLRFHHSIEPKCFNLTNNKY